MASKKGKANSQETSGLGFQGVALEGGGIGSTGSAKIAGYKLPAETKVEAEKKFPPAKQSKGKKKR